MIEKEWLVKKWTVDEVEAYELKELSKCRPDWVGTYLFKPFGMRSSDWESFKDRIDEASEIWSFSSSPLSWSCLCGRAGYALVKDGEVIDTITTVMN